MPIDQRARLRRGAWMLPLHPPLPPSRCHGGSKRHRRPVPTASEPPLSGGRNSLTKHPRSSALSPHGRTRGAWTRRRSRTAQWKRIWGAPRLYSNHRSHWWFLHLIPPLVHLLLIPHGRPARARDVPERRCWLNAAAGEPRRRGGRLEAWSRRGAGAALTYFMCVELFIYSNIYL